MAKGSTVDTLFLYALYAFMAYGLYMFWSGYGRTSYGYCKRIGGATKDAFKEVGREAWDTYNMKNWGIRTADDM